MDSIRGYEDSRCSAEVLGHVITDGDAVQEQLCLLFGGYGVRRVLQYCVSPGSGMARSTPDAVTAQHLDSHLYDQVNSFRDDCSMEQTK